MSTIRFESSASTWDWENTRTRTHARPVSTDPQSTVDAWLMEANSLFDSIKAERTPSVGITKCLQWDNPTSKVIPFSVCGASANIEETLQTFFFFIATDKIHHLLTKATLVALFSYFDPFGEKHPQTVWDCCCTMDLPLFECHCRVQLIRANPATGRVACVNDTYCDTWHIVPCRTPAGPEFDCGRWPIASVRCPSAERPPPWRTPRAPGCSVHTSEKQPQVRLLEFSVKKTFLKSHLSHLKKQKTKLSKLCSM